jgi:hypothetical protein
VESLPYPPSVEAQLPKTIRVFAGENEDFTVELNEGKTQEDVQKFVADLLVKHFCDTYRVVDCDLDELAQKMEGVKGIPARNGIIAAYNPAAPNGFFDIREYGSNGIDLIFGDHYILCLLQCTLYPSMRCADRI